MTELNIFHQGMAEAVSFQSAIAYLQSKIAFISKFIVDGRDARRSTASEVQITHSHWRGTNRRHGGGHHLPRLLSILIRARLWRRLRTFFCGPWGRGLWWRGACGPGWGR